MTKWDRALIYFVIAALIGLLVAINPAFVEMGRELELNLFPEEAKADVILYYDWSSGKFMCAGPYCPPSQKAECR
jgi:hypothetical protein